MSPLRVGLVGAGFAADRHAESFLATGEVELVGVASATPASREAFAARWACPAYGSVEALLGEARPHVVALAAPNRLHHPVTLAGAAAGAHVVVEKPLAMNLAEADEMLAACRTAGVHLLYGEQLCFAPRYRRVRELIRSGALGTIIQINHWERHGGPHARWFHDPAQSGGGVLLDMGCHGIEVARWLLDKEPVVAVSATLGRHKHPGAVEDHALATLRFSSGATAVIDASWAAPGGIDERIEVLGTHGAVSVDLARGQSILAYSDVGVGYAAEKVDHERGWFFVSHDEAWVWGWHGQFRHVVDVLLGRVEPEETGHDGRAVLEVVMAAYRSAAERREIDLPYVSDDPVPITPWLGARRDGGSTGQL